MIRNRFYNARKFIYAWLAFIALLVLAILAGVAFTVYKVLAFVSVF